jgi:cytochrome oxidase Cu insertion factor (SCO1/SenC/PrrC family)
MNNHHSRNLLLLGLLTMALTAAARPPRNSAAADFAVPAPGTYALPVVKAAADGEVLNGQGEIVRLRELTRGRVTVMSFIYTRCAAANACPMATGVLLQLHRLSAEDQTLAKHLRLVSLSFDPENDTPARMAAYSGLAEVGKPTAEWRFVTTASQEKLQPILAAYGQAVDRKANPNDPTGPLNHTLRVFLIDGAGNIRNIYSSGTLDLQLVLADVKTLMLEATSASAPPARTDNSAEAASPDGSAYVTARGRIESVPVLAQRQVTLNPVLLNP